MAKTNMQRITSAINKTVIDLLVGALRGYQVLVRPFLTVVMGAGHGCRFTPSCSDYAIQALSLHGPFKGFLLVVRRVCRCHPWGGCGYDPVPHPRSKSLKPTSNHNATA